MPKKKKNLGRLPNRFIIIKNPDKKFHEHWHSSRNKLNFPHPFRAVLLGPPNSGKTSWVKNILMRAHPPFKKIFVIHCDPEYTQEYDDVNSEFLTEIPAPSDWEGKVKTLVVLDDLEFKTMNKDQRRNLDRLFGFVSTHKNISCILCSQDPFNVPPIIRRCSNLWVLWRLMDMDSMATCARKTGMKSEDLKDIFNNFMPDTHDSLWIDCTEKTPYPFRKNGFEDIIDNRKNI